MSARAGGIPAELAHELAGARQAIDLPAALAPEMEPVLDRVLACSPYAADVLRRYPQVIGELAANGRLERANTPGEIGTRLGSEAAPDLAEEEFLRRLRVFSPIIMLAALVSLAAVLFIGGDAYGAKRWIDMGPMPFQPSEFAKLALIIYISAWLASYRRDLTSFGSGFMPFIFAVGVVAALILMEPDTGTAAVIVATTLALFFIAYSVEGLLPATAVLLAATALGLLLSLFFLRRVPVMPLVTAVVVGIFGGLTLWLQDETFIKVKPTIVEALFSAILFGGLIFGRPLLKPLLGHAWPMADRGWHLLSLRFAIFFAAMAVLNEIVWRTQTTDVWVSFKVFGLMILTLLFAVTQAPLMKRYALPLDKPDDGGRS